MELAVLIGGAVVAVGVVALWLSRNRGVTVVEVAPPRSAASSARPPVVVQGSGPVHDLLNAGRKIEAIKRYRELTGVGLKEAKDAVEALERGEGLVMPAPRPLAVAVSADAAIDDAELRAHLAADRPIEAIKRYRELTGLGLKESKDAIDALRETRKS
jgi:ribosomal protein L7/L12